MRTTIQAVYESGVLKLPTALPLPEQTHVLVTIETPPDEAGDCDRAAWLNLSQAALANAWDDPADEVFDALLAK